jgi:hypothetical protein
MIGQVACNKSSLLLKNILQNTKTLQPFIMNIKTKYLQKLFKNKKQWAWVERNLIYSNRGWSASAQSEGCRL